MPGTKTQPVTVRLPKEIVQALDAEATGMDMSRSEAVTRRLRKSFKRDAEVSKTDENPSNAERDVFVAAEEAE